VAIMDHSTGEWPDRLRAQIVSQVFPNAVEAASFGTMLSTRHGAYQVHGASLSIPGGVPVWTMTGHVYPHWRIRPNQVFSIPDLPDESEGLIGVFLRSSKFSWDQVTDNISITCGRLDDLKRSIRQLAKSPDQLEQQPNEPRDNGVDRATDRSAPSAPWGTGINPTGSSDPSVPDPTVVPLPQLPVSTRTITLHIPVSNNDPQGIVQVDCDCIIRMVSAYAPLDQDGTATVIVGHSTYEEYGSIQNLANLTISGQPGKARDPQVAQQLLAGDVVYGALPSPMTGYDYVIIAVTCERSW